MKASPAQWLICVLVAAVDCLIVFDAFSLAYLLRFEWQIAPWYAPPASPDEYFKAMLVVAYFWLLLFKLYGLYDVSRRRSNIDTVHLVARAITYGTLIILSLTYFYRGFSFSRLVCVYAWCISLVLFSGFRVALNLVRDEYHRRGRGTRRVLLVGSRRLASFLAETMDSRPELGYRVIGAVDNGIPFGALRGRVLGRFEDLEEVLTRHHPDRVFLAHPVLGHLDLLQAIDTCERAGVPLSMVPPTFDLMVNYRDFEEIDGIPLVKINEQEARRPYEVSKRVFDVALAGVALAVLSPLWTVLVGLIKLEDGGPALFVQRRVGKGGRTFRMLKFRTMVVGAERLLPCLVNLDGLREPVFKLEEDPRVTRIGRILRRTSLDELPQLINVLRGEMSLVGPRPEEEQIVARYDVWQRRRLKATPGITGLQQVECRGSTDLRERVRWDVVYLRKQTFVLDCWILLKTVWVVLLGRGAR